MFYALFFDSEISGEKIRPENQSHLLSSQAALNTNFRLLGNQSHVLCARKLEL